MDPTLAKAIKFPAAPGFHYEFLTKDQWRQALDDFCYFEDDPDQKLKNSILQGYATEDDLSADSIFLVDSNPPCYQLPYDKTFMVVVAFSENQKILAHLIVSVIASRSSLSFDLVLNKSGLTDTQNDELRHFSDLNGGILLARRFKIDVQDVQGFWHMPLRLPNFIQVNGHYRPAIDSNFVRFPDVMTVHGDFMPYVEGQSPLNKWPSEVTVHGSMIVKDVDLTKLPTRLKVETNLVINPTQVSTKSQVECLNLIVFSSRKNQKILDFKSFKIDGNVGISSPVGGIKNLKAKGNLTYKREKSQDYIV